MRDDDVFLLVLAAAGLGLLYELWQGVGGSSITVGYSPASSPGYSPATTTAFTGATDAGGGAYIGAPSPASGYGGQPVNVSPAGLAFIKRQEGLTLTAVTDAGGREIGYGHTLQAGQPSSITLDQAESYFAQDVAAVESTLNGLVQVPLTQGQYDALASLTYNIGAGAFSGSTLLRKLNAGDYAGAAAEFPRWNKVGGVTNTGLTARRAAEQGMFNSGSAIA